MSRPYLLIVHPDESTRALLRSMLRGPGETIDEASEYRIGVRKLGYAPGALVLAGADPSDPESSEFLTYVRRHHPRVPVILLTSCDAPELPRQAFRDGAASVLKVPFSALQVRAAVAHALHQPVAEIEPAARVVHPAAALPSAPRPAEAPLVGDDPRLREALDLARAVALIRTPFLIVGEPGTGKTRLARAIHQLSPRRDGPCIEVSCEATEDSSLEEDLFGPAGRDEVGHTGKVAQARGGTLVLDEIDALSPSLKQKLHLVLREGRHDVDVRLITTSRKDLAEGPTAGASWRDFFERISSVTLRLPPLRERGPDLVKLADHFLARSGRDGLRLTAEAREMLFRHHWPGNVAELEDVLKRAVSLCPGSRIEPIHLQLPTPAVAPAAGPPIRRDEDETAGPAPGARIRPLREALEEPEMRLILQALEASDWSRQAAARVLDINRTTLHKKMRKYGLFTCEGAFAD